jgi:hypothetical protein
MKLVTVQGSSEKLFWQFVTEDFREYYFFIYDWLLQREKSQVVLALDGETIAGLMLIYDNKYVQLRGSSQAAELLLDSLDLTSFELMAPLDCENQVHKKYPNPNKSGR